MQEEFVTDGLIGEMMVSEIVISDDPPFIIDGLVHEAATVLYGRPEAGKSYYALSIAAAVTEGLPWLKRNTRKGRVLFVGLDPGQVREIKRRWDKIPNGADFSVATKRPGNTDEWWIEFAGYVRENFDLIIFDNLTRLIPPGGSVRNDEDVKVVLDRLDRIVDLDVAVLLIHHSGKPGEDGLAKSSPMGATAIEGWARLIVRVERKRGTRLATLHIEGNDVAPFRLTTLHVPEGSGEHGAFFTIVAEDQLDKARRRTEERYDEATLIALHVDRSGKSFRSLNAVAGYLADYPPEGFESVSQGTWKKRLQRQVFSTGLLDGGKGQPVVAGRALLALAA